MTLQVTQYVVGNMKNCVYRLTDWETKTCLVVDPAWDVPMLCNDINTAGLQCLGVLLTHGHFDHVEGLAAFTAQYDVPVYVSDRVSASLLASYPALVLLADNTPIMCGHYTLHGMQTPGHSPDGMCFYCEPIVITGDTLFIDGCGRCDFVGSDVAAMYTSLHRLCRLPDHTQIYPGHDYGHAPVDTMGSQRERNRFLTCNTKEVFIRKRMGAR